MANRPELSQQLKEASSAYAVSSAAEMEPVPDEMLVDHLALANAQLREVLEAAGADAALTLQPSQDIPYNVQQQHNTGIQPSTKDELVTVLAEENYQLRQLLQQVQLQQQLHYRQQQHEAAAAADLLEFDRFDDRSPLAAVATGVGSSPVTAGSVVAPLHGQAPLTPRSPAVLAAGILVPPSASAVQLAEAEAAAQLMTQAVIQAEAAAHDSLTWQAAGVDVSEQQHSESCITQASVPQHTDDKQQHLGSEAAEAPAAQPSWQTERLLPSTCSPTADKPDEQVATSGLGLLNLPRLALPSRVLSNSCGGRSEASTGAAESQLSDTGVHTGAAAGDVCSAAVGGSVHSIRDIAHATQCLGQQQQQVSSNHVSTQVDPLQPEYHQNCFQRQLLAKRPGAAAAAQAGQAAAAFAGLAAGNNCVHQQLLQQQEQQQQLDGTLPGLPKLRVHRPSDVATDSEIAGDTNAVSCYSSECHSSASSSPCSDSGFFREALDEESSAVHTSDLVTALRTHGNGLQGRDRGSEVFTTSSRMSSDLFGARISMDGGSVGMLPRVSITGGTGSRDRLSELAGWYGAADTFDDVYEGAVSHTNTLKSGMNSSEWLGVSYQQSWCRSSKGALQQPGDSFDLPCSAAEAATPAAGMDASDSIDQQWPTLPKLQLHTRRQQRQISSSHQSSRDQQQQASDSFDPSGSLVPAPDIPDSYFFESSVSSLYDSFRGAQAGQKAAVATQSSVTAAATSAVLDTDASSRHVSDTTVLGIGSRGVQSREAPEHTPCVQTAAVPSGAAAAGPGSQRHDSEQQHQQSQLALPDLSLLDLSVAARSQQPTPAIGRTGTVSQYEHMADSHNTQQLGPSQEGQQQWVGGYTPEFAAAASAALNAVPGELEGMISSQQLRQLLMDLAMAQHRPSTAASTLSPTATDAGSSCTPSTARSNLLSTRSQLMFETVLESAGAADQRPAVGSTLQTAHSGGVPPRSPSKLMPKQQEEQQPEQQEQRDGQDTFAASAFSLQRAWSSGSISAQLPPKSGMRAGSSSVFGIAVSQQQQESSPFKHAGHAGDGTHMPAPAVPVPVRQGSAGGAYSTLRVVTTLRAAPSTGSNSDPDNSSTNTTPVHPHSRHTRNNSSSSIQYRPGSYLASITVPPSPGNSGVRYMPASPRVVGFDCPATPQSALRSPSWRSDHSTVGDSGVAGGSSTAAGPAGVNHVSHLSFGGAGGLGGSSTCSTPRRQPASPGLLHQALTRQGASGSNCSTPSSARRAGSVPCIQHCGSGALAGATPTALGPPSAIACAGRGSDKQHIAGSTSSVHSTGPLGIPSPPAGGMGVAHHRARSCSSATLLKMLTGGPLQQTALHNTSHIHPYIQQPQPLPLQQQQQQSQLGSRSLHRAQSDTSAYRSSVQPAAVDGAEVVYGSAVEDAVDSELRVVKPIAETHIEGHQEVVDVHATAGTSHHAASASSKPAVAAKTAVLDRLCRPASPLARSLSRSQSPSPKAGSSSGGSCSIQTAAVGRAASPAKGLQDGHPVKLSRFGLMAAAEAHAAPPSTTVQATASVGLAEKGHDCQVQAAAPADADGTKQPSVVASGSVLASIRTEDLSNASSVASPDTPALGDPDHAEATCPTAVHATSSFGAAPSAGESSACVANNSCDRLGLAEAAPGSIAGDNRPKRADPGSQIHSSADGLAVESVTVEDAANHSDSTAVGSEPPTPVQQQPHQKQIGASGASEHTLHVAVSSGATTPLVVPAADAAASALLNKLCSGKHHEVIVASGRREAQALPLLSRHSNAASVIRELKLSKASSSMSSCNGKAVPAHSPAVIPRTGIDSPVTPFGIARTYSSPYVTSPLAQAPTAAEERSPSAASNCDASGSSDSSGRQQADMSSSWTAQVLIEPVPQQFVRSSTSDTCCDRDQQQLGFLNHRDVECVTPGFVKSRVRSWSQSGERSDSCAQFPRTRTTAAAASCPDVVRMPDARAETWCSKRLRSNAAAMIRSVQRPFMPQAARSSTAGMLKRATKSHSKHKSAAAASLSMSAPSAAATSSVSCSNPFVVPAPASVSLPRTTADGWVVFAAGAEVSADTAADAGSLAAHAAVQQGDCTPTCCSDQATLPDMPGVTSPITASVDSQDTRAAMSCPSASSAAYFDCDLGARGQDSVRPLSVVAESVLETSIVVSSSDECCVCQELHSAEPLAALVELTESCAHSATQQSATRAANMMPEGSTASAACSSAAAEVQAAQQQQLVSSSSSPMGPTAHDAESAAAASAAAYTSVEPKDTMLQQRHLLQHVQRQDHVSEWVEQQRQQHSDQQQQHSSVLSDSEADALSHRVADQQQRRFTTDPPAHAQPTANSDGSAGESGEPNLSTTGPEGTPLVATNSVPVAAGAVTDVDGQIEAADVAEVCGSVNSDSNLSWAAWSTTSTVNRCPKLDWWGRGQGTPGGVGFFSQRHARKHMPSGTSQPQQQHVGVQSASRGFLQKLQLGLGISRQ